MINDHEIALMVRFPSWCGCGSAAVFAAVVLSAGTVQAASVHGGVYGWGWPTGTVSYIDRSLNGEDLPGVIGQSGELVYDSGNPNVGYTLKAQAILNNDALQGYIAVDNHQAAPTIQRMDGWINCFAGDTYTVVGGTPGDPVEAIFTCTVSGSLSILPQFGTSPHSHGTAGFNFGMHGTYGDPATIPNWIDAGLSIQHRDGGIAIESNDVYYYDDWDDDQYDLDRHTPVFTAMVEGQDYTVSGNTISIHATFQFPVTMVSGHVLAVESELDLTASTSDSHLYPDRASQVITDFWNTGVSNITLAPEYQDGYTIVRGSGVPEPATLLLLAVGGLILLRRPHPA